jgi:hypothetical protein
MAQHMGKKSSWRTLGCFLFAIILLESSVRGDNGGGWSLWNPFASKPKPPVSARVTDNPSGGWKMPSLWPKASASSRPGQPSAWQKMTSGTKNFFSKTADALTPWDRKPATPPRSVTGSNSVFTNNASKAAEKKNSSSIFPASWWSSDKQEQPKSVSEFLSQPRPN